jgi:hypothetical protein
MQTNLGGCFVISLRLNETRNFLFFNHLHLTQAGFAQATALGVTLQDSQVRSVRQRCPTPIAVHWQALP